MTSKIDKELSSGFVLTTEALRALVREAMGSAARSGDPLSVSFILHLSDGRLIVLDSVEDVIGQDNSGMSMVDKLQICASEDKELIDEMSTSNYPMLIGRYRDDNLVYIAFDRTGGRFRSNDIEMLIYSRDDNYALAAGARIEAKLKDITCAKLAKNLHREGFNIAAVLTVVYAALALIWSDSAFQTPDLRAMYVENRFKDPIDFLLFKEEETLSMAKKLIPIVVFVLMASIICARFSLDAARWLFPIRVFAWGGGQKELDKRRWIRNLVFVVIALGIAVSVVSSWIASKIFTI